MIEYNRKDTVENYYRASNALTNIGIMKNIPKELEKICLDASRATVKIIDYINDNKE